MHTLLVFLALTVVVRGNHYCEICSNHTMCMFEGFGAECALPLSWGLSEEDIKAVVDAHNEHRKRIAWGMEARGNPGPQPPASNMNKLEWDHELAQIAQTWAEQCIFRHDKCRNVDRFKVGQNIFRVSRQGKSNPQTEEWSRAVKAWYDEVEHFNPVYIPDYRFDEKWGHYAMAAWADTRFVGCGFMSYRRKDRLFSKYYVCNYGPGGNRPYGTMYKKGAPCRSCPSGSHCDRGLCVFTS